MSVPLLSSKLYRPSPRPKAVSRPRLTERLNEGLHRKLTVVSASAGFGKTTLLGEWIAGCGRSVAWLSLDEGDNDIARFLTYVLAALRSAGANVGEGAFVALRSSHSPPAESILTTVLNDIAARAEPIALVLDDYHVIDAKPVDEALAFLIERMPPGMHLVVATREDPNLPLARLRARDQLNELRAADLRFTLAEATGFLNSAMGLILSPDDVVTLEARTEGWIAGLQLAAISMQGHQDTTGFIRSFGGSHRFVLDYLLEEVLHRQPDHVQRFLLRTSVLDRLCGPLADAVLLRDADMPGQETLAYLEKINLFIVPLDNERRWYRYHHLFAELLKQRLLLSVGEQAAAALHARASEWYEENGLEMEAFRHAVAARDVERAARLAEGKGLPLHFRGEFVPVLNWLESLPELAFETRPSLCVVYASVLLMAGQTGGVEPKLRVAEAGLAIEDQEDGNVRDLIGHIASIRASAAASRHEVETILAESNRALAYLHPRNLPVRTATTWTLGYAYHLMGDRAAAGKAYAEAMAVGESIGHSLIASLAAIGLGLIQHSDNRLRSAADTYRHVLRMAGDSPIPAVCEAHLGLAKLHYEWNELNEAEQHGRKSVQLARMLENTDRFVACELMLARIRLARGDEAGAAAIVAEAGRFARRHGYLHQLPDIAAAEVAALIRRGDSDAAARVAVEHDLPISLAKSYLAQGNASAAIAALERPQLQAEERGWEDERLKVMIVRAISLRALGQKEQALPLLDRAMELAEPERFVRLFVDEGRPMGRLLSEVSPRGSTSDYAAELLAVFETECLPDSRTSAPALTRLLIEPLSTRESEVLRLIADGLSNQDICDRLFLALSTVKGYNRIIFDKLQVRRRTEAVARARELGLI
ncbi:LuxR C-terminal-related transcriptional regulator [Cohnella suwonensis]|uniref:LuxR C-terminal-related transcriptional regulator n=1 Tax=Cohnella suwonensis TaxID=696072 RepID=A0ABW0M132_9BACL